MGHLTALGETVEEAWNEPSERLNRSLFERIPYEHRKYGNYIKRTAKVGIIMGSDSDLPSMSKAADMLRDLGVPYEMTVVSAHRTCSECSTTPVKQKDEGCSHHRQRGRCRLLPGVIVVRVTGYQRAC